MQNQMFDSEVLYAMIHKDRGALSTLEQKVDSLSSGFNYIGSVDDISDLPASGTVGDQYTVLNDDNALYVWDGEQWVRLAPDLSVITDVIGNLFSDAEAMSGATGITRVNGSEYVGTASAFQTFLLNNYTLDPSADSYVIAFDIYTEANSSSSGTGLEVQYGSRSDMSTLATFDNDQTEPYHFENFFSVTYAPTVTDRTLGLKFKANSAPNNIWHISNIRLFEGMEIPDAVTAKDTDAREKVDEAVNDLKDLKSSIADTTDYALNAYATDTASGSIATLPDGADGIPIKSLSVAIEPVQDLHGQDAPYPAGGGANLIPDGTDTNNGYIAGRYLNSDGSYGTGTYDISEYFPIEAGVTYTCAKYTTAQANAVSICFYDSSKSYISGEAFNNRTSFQVVAPSDAAFARATVDSTSSTTPHQFLVAKGEIIPTKWQPYSNICPISGHTECNIARTGINVWDEEWENGTFQTSTGENINGTSENQQIRVKNYIPVVGGATYYVKAPSGIWMMFFDKNKSVIAQGLPSSSAAAGNCRQFSNKTLTIPNDCAYIRFYCQAVYGATYNYDISINYPSTDTDYHKGTVDTYPITFPSGTGTVYGGNVTVNQDGSGSLVVDRKNKSSGWARERTDSSGKCWLVGQCIGAIQFDASEVPTDTISNFFAVNSLENIRSLGSGFTLYSGSVWIAGYENSTDALDTILQTFSVVYPLVNPITIPLSASQIRTLLGTNNLWADCNGDISVTYRADTALYVQKKIAEALA